MADRKKIRRKFDEDDQPTKEDYAVAKFLRFNVPTREAKLHNMEVHCFFGSAAVDALMESKWSTAKHAKEPLFHNRHSCVSFCQRLIQKGMFHRAERVQRKKDKEKDKGDKSKKKKVKEITEKEETGTGDELRERKGKKDKKGKKEKEDTASEKTQPSEKEGEEKKEEKKDEGKKKKEKRLKLVMTDDQRFLDGEENIYVWIYDPVNAKTLMIGSLIVLGAIALCLFPLWPEVVRVGVYYVSLAAAGFVGFILSLVVIRLVLFCCIWVVTLGRHHFWLLPNLTEDVGFFESFRPLYKHDAVVRESVSDASKDKEKSSPRAIESKAKSKSKSKKDKSSDKEESGSEQDEFEVINRGDVEEEEEEEERLVGEEREEGEEDTEDNGGAGEDYGPDDDEDYDEDEQNGAPDEEDEEEDDREDGDEDSQLKKDK